MTVRPPAQVSRSKTGSTNQHPVAGEGGGGGGGVTVRVGYETCRGLASRQRDRGHEAYPEAALLGFRLAKLGAPQPIEPLRDGRDASRRAQALADEESNAERFSYHQIHVTCQNAQHQLPTQLRTDQHDLHARIGFHLIRLAQPIHHHDSKPKLAARAKH